MAGDSDQTSWGGAGVKGVPAGDSRFLHRSVSDALRKRLRNGDFGGAGKLPPLQEIAAEYRVSTMTVRRAIRTLEHEGHVERLVNVGVFARSAPDDEEGVPSPIAFVGSDLDSPFQMSLANGAQRAYRRTGRAVQILDGHFDAELEGCNISRLPGSGVRGAIVLPPFSHSKTLGALERLHAAGFPMVLVDQTVPGLRTDLVTSDHEAGAYRATTYLLARGHSGLVFLTHPCVTSSVAARYQGYERALQDNGRALPGRKAWINVEEQLAGYREGRKWFGGYRAILPVLKECRPPLAVLAIDAYAGWGVYEACREIGLRIPEDVSVIAFDETEIVHAMRPPMTIIAQRLDEVGRAAVDLLEERIRSGPVEDGPRKTITHVLIDVDIEERGSVATLGEGRVAVPS